MTRLGVRAGVDLVDAGRMQRMLEEDASFLDISFTPEERTDCAGDASRLASRWAAKEATMKALGRGIGVISPLDVEIVADSLGAPALIIRRSALERSEELGVSGWTVTLGHESDMAIAVVIAIIGGECE